VLGAGGQVLAVAVALVERIGAAHRQAAADGRLARDHQVGLVVAAVGPLSLAAGLVSEALGHVLDRAADGVAAVQRALRAAQHFDALDVEHVEHRALRAIDVDVVDIEADAGLVAPQRILLADAADVGSGSSSSPGRSAP
jgi:hypothetical protein